MVDILELEVSLDLSRDVRGFSSIKHIALLPPCSENSVNVWLLVEEQEFEQEKSLSKSSYFLSLIIFNLKHAEIIRISSHTQLFFDERRALVMFFRKFLKPAGTVIRYVVYCRLSATQGSRQEGWGTSTYCRQGLGCRRSRSRKTGLVWSRICSIQLKTPVIMLNWTFVGGILPPTNGS